MVEQRHALVDESVPYAAEEVVVMENAHVFEHADGNNPIVHAGLLPVIAQEELRALREAALRRTRARHFELLF